MTARASRLALARAALTRDEWVRLATMIGVVAALHLIGWVTLAAFVAPQHFNLGDKSLGLGVGLTAYALGLRHAFDADHISAIDNTTRKLMADGQRPLSVGLYFSLGHSTVVLGLAVLLSTGIKGVVGAVQNDASTLHHYTGLIGTSVSGTFLLLIAIVNIGILAGTLKVFRRMRSGAYDEAELEEQLNKRGLLNRIFGGRMNSITRPSQMYVVGLLFGLGFDTATEVALLVLAGTSAAAGLPWYAIVCLPVLFAAGMSLLDTADGTFMNFAYGWAFLRPVRKVYYNITITGLSIAIALIVGGIELLGLLAQQLGWTGGFWDGINGVDLSLLGLIIVGLFVVTWIASLTIWHYAKIEAKWSANASAAVSPLE
ncbi:HoxN/HupN/NixA family nickel/cobalt transporter [Mycobacterium sp. CBMA293]|nr:MULTISPECIES: HoxN/HupN/NixA family nickel/cobalt transporter [unclassified Mycolicibacterium]MUL48175.1 HoxN/HupN/NixA family nickel/cobalt transporter [Mycolicibacterium sp. CBMA 360]MUL57656.1 HoxN/HupN/NixA family nickel/cobalt transporter [Mycolicibacterium sp. CBMA 335]MUL70696.1 HoxN/HupN/NixA family nickel/cobalt transporter [Mycolicibacterium sp. CBMA 311]MUL92744.1 HoxN/HupN/NixA family nickel/cobalt transporter [Mycolicibacterium sp. CBMA 230]MUM08241.1 nickel transporter [Mycoli